MTTFHPNANIGACKYSVKSGGAVNKIQTVTCAATEKVHHAVDFISASFDAAGEARVSVKLGGTEVWAITVWNSGHYTFDTSPIYSDVNEELVVTLAADAAAIGTLSTGIRTSITPVAATT